MKNKKLEQRKEELQKFLRIQETCLCDNYMIGMYNGMELALALLEERNPVYKDCITETQVVEHKEQKGRTVASGIIRR